MISGKGILYTVLGAASAAVVVGTMITGGKKGEKLKNMGAGIQNFLGSLKSKRSITSSSDALQRAEFNQANNAAGHA
jgi:hypothetical protein